MRSPVPALWPPRCARRIALPRVRGRAAIAGRSRPPPSPETARGFAEIMEPEEPGGIGQVPAWPGVLDHGRLAAGEVAQSPVADPGVLQANAGWFHPAEFAAGILDVGLVAPGCSRHRARVADAPAACGQGLAIGCLARAQRERQFQRHLGSKRQVPEGRESRPSSSWRRYPASSRM